VLVLSACGGSSNNGGSGSAQVLKAGTVDINAQPADKVKDGGTMNLPFAQWPTQWNFNQTEGAAVDLYLAGRAIWQEPFLAQADGSVKPNPNLLDSAALISTSPQVAELKINKKAHWSDGTPITYKDWVADWQAQNGSNPAFQPASTVGWDSIGSIVRGTDDQDVKITFSKPFAEWKGLTNLLYPASVYSTPDEFNKGWVDKIPVTDGPFKVKSIDDTDKTLTIVRDPNWWGPKPKLDSITFKAIPASSQAQALQGGDIDAMDIGPSVPNYKTLASAQGITIHKALSPDFRVLTFGARAGSPMADPKVRIALMKGIDRTLIGKAVLGPIVPNVQPLNNRVYVQGQSQYQDDGGQYAYNKDEAARELDAAGWKLPAGQQVRQKDGKPLELQFVVPSDITYSADEAQQVQLQLGQIGVKVDINTVDVNAWQTQYLDVGNFDILNQTWESTPFPISSDTNLYGYDPNNVGENYGRIPDTQGIDQLFTQANQQLDDTKRTALANEIDQKLWAEGFSLPLYDRPDCWATKSTVANFGAFGFSDPDYTQVGFTS
jgi:peptide/nickel transport system substrate-binding protein